METTTGQTTLANKRIRFDATAQAGNTIISPLNLAIGHIQSHTVSLLPEIQAIFNKLGCDYIKLQQRVSVLMELWKREHTFALSCSSKGTCLSRPFGI